MVDDDRDLVAAVRLILEARGFDVSAAYDAGSGMARAEAERPDLILLDVMMPNATEGFHFVWRLRQHGEAYFQRVPIIMLTAIHEKTALRFYPDSGDGTYRAGEYLPIQAFVDKPVDPGVLVARVEAVLAAAAT
jgi:DNA-binding response OmpR family regulator